MTSIEHEKNCLELGKLYQNIDKIQKQCNGRSRVKRRTKTIKPKQNDLETEQDITYTPFDLMYDPE